MNMCSLILTSVQAATRSCISIPASASATEAQTNPAERAIKQRIKLVKNCMD